MESLHIVKLSGVADPAPSVSMHSSSWPLVDHFTFLEDLRKRGTSGPRTLEKSVDW